MQMVFVSLLEAHPQELHMEAIRVSRLNFQRML